MSTETARVAGGAQEPVGSPLSAGSSADLETPKSASSQQKSGHVLSLSAALHGVLSVC